MELGQRLKQARLDAGLSQRQLCGEEITRNMLSQIENGSARPSMATLQYLAARLGKSVSWFLEEQAVTSPNQALMAQARAAWASADAAQTRQLLENYRPGDETFDAECRYLQCLAAMHLAQQALEGGKAVYALTLLEQAESAAAQTCYDTPALQRQRLLLAYRAKPERARQLAAQLPPDTWEVQLRAAAALADGDGAACARILDGMPGEDAHWHYLRAEAALALGAYAEAVPHYQKAEAAFPRQALERLEQCFRELEDYKQAYFYACKRREL